MKLLFGGKKKSLTIIAVAFILTATAFKAAENIITRLGMQQSEANKNIFGNMMGDFVYFSNGENGQASHGVAFKIPVVKLLPDIIKGDKAGAARELCAYVKMYCNSEDFMNDYNQHRNLFKPTSEPVRDANFTKANKDLVKMYKESIVMYEKYLADAKKAKNASSIASYEKGLADLRRQVAELEDPTPKKTAWEKKYPATPDAFVKARLEEYLSLVATVDFSAKLVAKGDKMVFVNPAYENKSVKWKAIYRAGKEVNDTVTDFVKDWLKGEIIATVKTKMPVDTDESNTTSKTSACITMKNEKSQSVTDSASTKKKKGIGVLKNKINQVIGNR